MYPIGLPSTSRFVSSCIPGHELTLHASWRINGMRMNRSPLVVGIPLSIIFPIIFTPMFNRQSRDRSRGVNWRLELLLSYPDRKYHPDTTRNGFPSLHYICLKPAHGVIFRERQSEYKRYCRWRRWRRCATSYRHRYSWDLLPATAAGCKQRSQKGNDGGRDYRITIDVRSSPNFDFKEVVCACFPAVALRSCLFMSSFSCTPPTTGLLLPEMQATPWVPDVSSQVVSGPHQGFGSTLNLQSSSESPPQYDNLSTVAARPSVSTFDQSRGPRLREK